MKIGAVPYFNAYPLCRYLPLEIRYEKPAVLEKLMKEGQLDIALLPVFSFFQSDYVPLFEGGFIQSDGPVESVLLFYREDLPSPSAITSIRYTQASRTSVNLFKVLYALAWKKPLESLEVKNEAPDAILEIGDEALFFDRKGYKVCDLGAAWKEWTGLPFVYACWVSRKPVPAEIATLFEKAKNEGLKKIPEIAQSVTDWEPAKMERYLTKCLQYEMLPRTLEGLRRFQESCFELGLIDKKRSIP